MTPEEAVAAGGVEDSAPVAAAPRARAPVAKTKTVAEVPIVFGPGEKEKHIATVARLNEIKKGLGLDTDEEGQVLLDNDKSNAVTNGYDPEAHSLNMRRYGLEMRKGEAAAKTGERSGIGEFLLGDKDYDPYKDLKGGYFSAPKTKALNDAQREWALISQLVGHREEGKVGADPSTYLYSRDAAESTKRETRERLASKLTEEANTLPDAGGGAAIKEQFKRIADYVRTTDPSLLHGAHRTMQDVAQLAQYASPPVRDAALAAIREQSDPKTSSILDAARGAFLNNVAPLTVAGGSAIAQPLGSGRTTGEGTSYIHQRLLTALAGLPPEQQAAAIQKFKEEHPAAYAAGAVGGWLADPVGLLGGKAFSAAREGAAALGLGKGAATLAAATGVGAPAGVLLGRGAGTATGAPGAADVANAATGVAGELAGAGVNAAFGKVGAALGGAPARIEHADLAAAAKSLDHEVTQQVYRGDATAPANHWKEVYRRLNAMIDRPQRQNLTLNPTTGRFKELEHAVDLATAKTHSMNASPAHALGNLANQDLTVAQKVPYLAREAAERRGGIGLMALAIGSSKRLAGMADKGVAKLVTAIRSADPAGFRFALREAREAGVSHEMIQGAEEAYAKRNRERVSEEAAAK